MLRVLRSSPAMAPAELAQHLRAGQADVSNLLRDLEAAGLVTRARSEVDLSVTSTITEQARAAQDAFQRGRARSR